MYGSFNEEAKEIWDFVRCQRPDGTFYGTRGKCRKGKEVEPKAKGTAKGKGKTKAKDATPVPVSKPKLGGELVGNIDRLTGGDPRKQIESQIAYYEDAKKKYPDAAQSIDPELNKLRGQLEGFKANERLIESFVANVPAGTKVSVSNGGYLVTEYTTKSGHTVETSFGRGEFGFSVNTEYDAGSVRDRREQIEVANAVRRTYEGLVRALPEGGVIWTKAWTQDGRGESRMKAYEKMGFSKPVRIKYGEEEEGGPGDKQYSKKSDGKMVPATSSEMKDNRSYNFSEKPSDTALWYVAIFGD